MRRFIGLTWAPNRFAAWALAVCLTLFALAAAAADSEQVIATDTSAAMADTMASGVSRPDLSGEWILNESLSDDPREVMKKQFSGGRGGGRGGGSGGGGDRSGGGGGRGGMGGQRGGNRGSDMGWEAGGGGEEKTQDGNFTPDMKSLQILLADPELNITDSRNRTSLYYTDGRECEIWTDKGLVKAEATWTGAILMVKSEPENGPSRVEEYMIVPESGRMIVSRTITPPQGGQSVIIKMVYDRVAPGSE